MSTMEYHSSHKGRNPAICDNVDKYESHHAKRNKLDKERQTILYDIIYTKS